MSSQLQANVTLSQTPTSTSTFDTEELRSTNSSVHSDSPTPYNEPMTGDVSPQVSRLCRWCGILPPLKGLNVLGFQDMLPYHLPHAPTKFAVEPINSSQHSESHINIFAGDPPFTYERMDTQGDLLLTQDDTALRSNERIVGRERMRSRGVGVGGVRRSHRDEDVLLCPTLVVFIGVIAHCTIQ